MSAHIQVLTTIDSSEAAGRLAQQLVEANLAACVQVLGPLTSTYRWEGKVETAQEWLCIAKTREDRYGEVEAAIRAAHPYQVPEILAVPVTAGHEAYLRWLDAQVRRGDGP
jgi:periplasmic divalent cation tolerance protein